MKLIIRIGIILAAALIVIGVLLAWNQVVRANGGRIQVPLTDRLGEGIGRPQRVNRDFEGSFEGRDRGGFGGLFAASELIRSVILIGGITVIGASMLAIIHAIRRSPYRKRRKRFVGA